MRSSTNSCAEPVFVNAGVPFAACVAVAVERIVALYKQVLEIRKLRGELQKQAVPEKITNDLEDHANKLITDEIPNSAAKIMAEFYRGENLERKNELTLKVEHSLTKIATRIDQGFNLEVRIEPSKDADGAAGSADAKKAEVIIQSATKNMQFLKLEGDPILRLTEKREREEKPKKKPLGGRKIELEK